MCIHRTCELSSFPLEVLVFAYLEQEPLVSAACTARLLPVPQTRGRWYSLCRELPLNCLCLLHMVPAAF